MQYSYRQRHVRTNPILTMPIVDANSSCFKSFINCVNVEGQRWTKRYTTRFGDCILESVIQGQHQLYFHLL